MSHKIILLTLHYNAHGVLQPRKWQDTLGHKIPALLNRHANKFEAGSVDVLVRNKVGRAEGSLVGALYTKLELSEAIAADRRHVAVLTGLDRSSLTLWLS
ncbi:MAG: hypothetical protein M1818_007638 [Claussenomyces sp. TS43310]|nr:MAG: hypothetical protein M1818_007638 [Claussenomyces sp. TS43310]